MFRLHCIFQLTLLLLSQASDFIAGRAISPKGHRQRELRGFSRILVSVEGRAFLGRMTPFFVFSHTQRQPSEVKNEEQTPASARVRRDRVLFDGSSLAQGSQPISQVEADWSRTRNRENVSTTLRAGVVRDGAEPAVTPVKLVTAADRPSPRGNFS